MIASFGDKVTEALYHGTSSRATRRIPQDLLSGVLRKLDILNAAQALQDLRAPAGNRLEALKGDLAGMHSIRVNDQWRLVFRWEGTDAHEVSLMDYHQ